MGDLDVLSDCFAIHSTGAPAGHLIWSFQKSGKVFHATDHTHIASCFDHSNELLNDKPLWMVLWFAQFTISRSQIRKRSQVAETRLDLARIAVLTLARTPSSAYELQLLKIKVLTSVSLHCLVLTYRLKPSLRAYEVKGIIAGQWETHLPDVSMLKPYRRYGPTLLPAARKQDE